MSAPIWPLQRNCDSFYGDPRGPSGVVSPTWKSANLVTIKVPWQLVTAWHPHRKVSGIQIHKACAASLSRILNAIWTRFGHSYEAIKAAGMHLFGGSFNYRKKRGGKTLSMHAYGCAVDFDPERNAMGDAAPQMDPRVVEEFEREGWEWGGHWKDGMHFQAARTRETPKRLVPVLGKVEVVPPLPRPKPASVDLRNVERMLLALYPDAPILVDGILEGGTRRTLLTFKLDWNDRHPDRALPLNDEVTPDVSQALMETPLPAERTEATPADLAPNSGIIRSTTRSRRTLWTAISALLGMGGVNAVEDLDPGVAADKLDGVGRLVHAVASIVTAVPPWLLYFGLAAILGYLAMETGLIRRMRMAMHKRAEIA